MKRTSLLLVAVLVLVLAACGADQTATSSPTASPSPTVEPTEAATPTPTEEPTSSPDATDDDGSGSTGQLAASLPEAVGGLARQEIPGMGDAMEDVIASSLEQQGLDAEDADFAFAMYGQGELIVTAFSVPGVPAGQLQTLARFMSGMQVEGAEDMETEAVDLGGKEVLRMSMAGQPQSVFLYIADGAMYSVVAESEDLAAELLTQLP